MLTKSSATKSDFIVLILDDKKYTRPVLFELNTQHFFQSNISYHILI